MYRRRRGPNLFPLILLGVIAGVIFLIYDNRDSLTPGAPATPTVAPTSAVILTPQTVAEQPIATITPIARPIIFIPAMGIEVPIIEVFLDGTSWDVSKLGTDVGHLEGTPSLDEPGNIVLSGHVELRDGRRGAFTALSELKAGDTIFITHKGSQHRYVVNSNFKVEPDDLTPLYPSDKDRLTLITCGDYDFISGAYLKRVVVVADRVS